MVIVFSASYSEAMNVRSLLESSSIEVFIINEHMSTIEPWVISPGGFNPVTLKVKNEDVIAAKKIIEDYRSGSLTLWEIIP